MLRLIIGVLAVLIPQFAHATAVPHAFAERNTEFTTSSTSYTDVTDLAITSGNFTAGKDYYISYCVQGNENGNAAVGSVRMVHGSTAFAESEQGWARSSTNVEGAAVCWFSVWTAVASEGLKVQVKSSVGTDTVAVNFGALIAIQLTDYLVSGTDYCFAQSTADDSLSTTPTDGASCTVTPSSASTWLAQTYAQIDRSDTTTNEISRMVRSGEASSSLPASNTGPESVLNYGHYHARTFSFGATSNTIKEQAEAEATAHTRLHSSVFLLNLSRFEAHAAAYTEGATSLTSTTFVEIQTATITPLTTGDVWIGAAFVLDKTETSSDVEFRVQVDGSDQPAGQTTAALVFDQYNTTHTDNDIPLGFMTLTSLSSGAHRIDMDANRNTNSDVKYKQIFAVRLELTDTSSSRQRSVVLLP